MSDTFETTVGGAVEKINIADLKLPQSNNAVAAETLKLAGEAPTETKKPEEKAFVLEQQTKRLILTQGAVCSKKWGCALSQCPLGMLEKRKGK